jgi:peroxiredoxin
MIRDFALVSHLGESIRISSFRGKSNLALIFSGNSDAMRGFLDEMQRHGREFAEQDTTIVAVVPCGLEEQTISIKKKSPILVLFDNPHAVYRISGATENGRPVPLVYLTDRFGEIVSTYIEPEHSMPPTIEEILRTLEFINHQCPECEPPEWPR